MSLQESGAANSNLGPVTVVTYSKSAASTYSPVDSSLKLPRTIIWNCQTKAQ
jgi:hypothetical protein